MTVTFSSNDCSLLREYGGLNWRNDLNDNVRRQIEEIRGRIERLIATTQKTLGGVALTSYLSHPNPSGSAAKNYAGNADDEQVAKTLVEEQLGRNP